MTFLAERGLYRATPSMTRCLGVWCIIRSTAPICRLVRRAKDYEDQLEYPSPIVLRLAIRWTFVLAKCFGILDWLPTPMIIVRWPGPLGGIEEVIGQRPKTLITNLSLTHRLSIVRCPTVDRLVSRYIGGKVLMISANNQPMSVMTFVNNRPMSDRYSSIYMYDGCMTNVTEIGRITLDATWKPQPPHNGWLGVRPATNIKWPKTHHNYIAKLIRDQCDLGILGLIGRWRPMLEKSLTSATTFRYRQPACKCICGITRITQGSG